MEAVLGPDAPQGEGSVAGAGEVGLDGGQLLELGHEPGQRWPHDNGDEGKLRFKQTDDEW